MRTLAVLALAFLAILTGAAAEQPNWDRIADRLLEVRSATWQIGWTRTYTTRDDGGTYGMTVLPLDDPEHGVKGRSWAWVSLVDNVTNDPTNWW